MDEFDQKMEISEQPQEEIVEKIPGRDVYETVSSLVSALLVVVLVFTFLVRLMGVSGPSMIPTLQDGDRLLVVNSLLCGDYQVGDIVIARKETFDSKPIVKRVIATAGQTVDIDFNLGQVYVDGELLDEDYINDYTYREEGTVFPLTVPEGEVFLMGDNRNHSNDSRDSSLGTVDTRLLIGKAVFLVFPGRDYLTEQRDDVEKAKGELVGVIDSITSEMTVIFKEQFALIRESFQETFLELFGGGKATLELEDENDVLSCGIEIKVQPPGKALKTITLLSGGEKAFVAIALYFAILKVHPTPFCVMDEIEAALDEPNVVRVANYMRRITSKTQFIVITHRRGTMEAADVLYGVTMQERGVSKVLTINMNDMAKELNIKE